MNAAEMSVVSQHSIQGVVKRATPKTNMHSTIRIKLLIVDVNDG